MKDDFGRPSPSTPRSLWASWCDGFWLCVWFGAAALLAFTVPSGVFGWLLGKAGKGGVVEAVVGLCGAAFFVAASPIIVSRVFRELDYPWGRVRAERAPDHATSLR